MQTAGCPRTIHAASFRVSPDPTKTAAQFEAAMLAGFQGGTLNFGARFMQVNAGAGSDKLLGGTVTSDGPPTPTAVPEPATLAMALSGLIPIGFTGLRRLRLVRGARLRNSRNGDGMPVMLRASIKNATARHFWGTPSRSASG